LTRNHSALKLRAAMQQSCIDFIRQSTYITTSSSLAHAQLVCAEISAKPML